MLIFWHYVGNRFLSLLTNMLYNTTSSDMETCYKLFRREVLRAIDARVATLRLRARGHGQDAARRAAGIYEVPISYSGRDYDEGKKITWRDGIKALGALIRFRFGPR